MSRGGATSSWRRGCGQRRRGDLRAIQIVRNGKLESERRDPPLRTAADPLDYPWIEQAVPQEVSEIVELRRLHRVQMLAYHTGSGAVEFLQARLELQWLGPS